MIAQAIEMLSNELTERNASSRHQKQMYVFPIGEEVSIKHIAKFVFKNFFAFVFFEYLFLLSDSI